MTLPIHTIVRKLVGPIIAVGETNADCQRMTNLKATIDLVDKLLLDILEASHDKGRPEASMREIGTIAHKFLVEVSESMPSEVNDG